MVKLDKLRIKEGKRENRTNHSRIEEFDDEGGGYYKEQGKSYYNFGVFGIATDTGSRIK